MMPLVSASTMKSGDTRAASSRAGARVAELLWQTAQVCWNTASCALCGDGVNCTDAGPDADIMIAPARMRMHWNRTSLRDIIG